MSVFRSILYPKEIGTGHTFDQHGHVKGHEVQAQAPTMYLFGGSDILPRLVEDAQQWGYMVRVYTSPRQATENVRGETLLHALSRCVIPPVVTEDINAALQAESIPANSIGFGLGEAWTFSKEIRDAFGDRLLDFMSVPLPKYRGGAHISWAIMRGERRWGGRLQLITDNTVQGEADDGWIVDSWDYEIPSWCRLPQEWFNVCGSKDISYIARFLTQIGMGRPFPAAPIDETKGSLFFPRLKTVDNGWIDWSQNCLALSRQICAFDEPYPGAKTYIGDREAVIKDVTYDGLVSEPAPFQRGLVVRIDKDLIIDGSVHNGIHIAGVDGVILARRVLCGGVDITNQVKVGWRFITPIAKLESALANTPVYTPKA